MNHIRIVLLRPSHPGNIGSAARAIKVMGMDRLIVVDPQCDPFDGKAKALSAHAEDVWQQLEQVEAIDQAIEGCHLVVGTTARNRALACEIRPLRSLAEEITANEQRQAAILFGSEKDGMSNHELNYCHCQIRISTAEKYSSLNLAQAVQIISYELWMAQHQQPVLNNISAVRANSQLATAEQLNGLYQHLEGVMRQTGFYKPSHPRRMETRLRQIFNRASLDEQDIHLLRGIFDSVDRYVKKI